LANLLTSDGQAMPVSCTATLEVVKVSLKTE